MTSVGKNPNREPGPPDASVHDAGENRISIQRQARISTTLSLAALFLGMPLALLSVSAGGESADSTLNLRYTVVLLISIVLALPAASYTLKGRPVLAIDACLLVLCLSGVVAPLSALSDGLFTSVAYSILLIARLALIFVTIPRSLSMGQTGIVRTVLGWCIAGAGVHVLSGFREAIGGHASTAWARLGEESGVHPNLIGSNCAAAIVCVALFPGMRLPFRLAIWTVSGIVLVQTESRTSLIATVAAICVIVLMWGIRSSPLRAVTLTFCGIVAMGTAPLWSSPILEQAQSIHSLKRIIDRTTNADPLAGRGVLVQRKLNLLTESPAFGFGYKAPNTYVENGIVSIAMETGFFGLFAYISIYVILMISAAKYYHHGASTFDVQVARAILILGALMMIRTLGERSHFLQLSEPVPNAWLILCGLLFLARIQRGPKPVQA